MVFEKMVILACSGRGMSRTSSEPDPEPPTDAPVQRRLPEVDEVEEFINECNEYYGLPAHLDAATPESVTPIPHEREERSRTLVAGQATMPGVGGGTAGSR